MGKESEKRSSWNPARLPEFCRLLRFLSRTCAALTLCLLFSLSPFLLVFLSPCQGEESEGLPVFRRLLLLPERLPEELKRVHDGVLVRMPVAEFDALVERAAQSAKRRVSPQLIEAWYHATLNEENLIGEGQWKLVHNGPGSGLLSLQSFNLALRQARFENGDALIAAFDGKTPALLVESPGERTVSLDWSARAESGPEGLQFHLEMPPCPVALLELDVPAGRAVTVLNDSALLSGPHEAEKRDLRRWKVVCGGRQQVDRQRIDLRIYPAEQQAVGAHSQRALFVHQKTTQKLKPEGLDAAFELTLDSLSSGIRELVCDCDPTLRLREVVGPGVDDYSFNAGDEHKPSRLTIRLHESVRAGTWKIICLAPLKGETGDTRGQTSSLDDPQSIVWRSPGLHLINGVSRGETLSLWLDPDLRAENWDPGSFRLNSSDLDRATGVQVLTLSGGGLGPPRRPTIQLRAHRVEFSTQQLTWWRCNAGGMSLTVQIGWDVSQGQLFQLPVLLPAGWEVEKVEMAPPYWLRDWHVRKADDKVTLFADLANALGPQPSRGTDRTGEPAQNSSLFASSASGGIRPPALTVQLRPTGAGQLTEQRLGFPDAVPLGARFREGALALSCDEQLFYIHVQTSAERSEPESEGPWGQQLPGYYYRYRGQPVTGEIQIRPRPPRLRAKCENEVLVAGGEAVIESHLLLEAEVGSPKTIELLLSAGNGEPWQWGSEAVRGEEAMNNRVRRIERMYDKETSWALHLLASSDPFQVAASVAARPTGEHWRLTLARPLRLREPLRLRARHRLLPHNNRWDVPLPVVLGSERMEGEIVLHLADAGLALLRSVGLHESTTTEESVAPWRTLRYGHGEVSLTLAGEARASEHTSAATIEKARLVTYVGENDALRHHFSFQVANWGERAIPLRLPLGSRPLAVQVDGRWLPQLIPSTEPSTNKGKKSAVELALPVPNSAQPSSRDQFHSFEVVYTAKVSRGRLWQVLEAPTPQLPITPVSFRRIWRLSPKLTPLHQERYQQQPGTSRAVALSALPNRAHDLFRFPGSLDRFDPLVGDPQAGAREALQQTFLKLYNRHADQTVTLREVVREITFDYIKDHYNLIIDQRAFQEARLGPETRLTIKRLPSMGAAPWVEDGLSALPARSAILMTTKTEHGTAFREPLSEDVENALAEAARLGQNASGRFRSALRWLYPESNVPSPEVWPQRLEFRGEGVDESEWEPVVGMADEQLIVVRRDGVTALGLALALVLALLLSLPRRRSPRRQLRLVLLAMALSGLAVLWLPGALSDLAWWPLMASGIVAILMHFTAVVRKPGPPQLTSRQPQNAASIASAIGVLVLGGLSWNSRAAAPAPPTVYLVPASADAPDKQTVLVPADFLDRLKKMVQPAPLAGGGPQSVLLDAAYEGQLVEEGKRAEFLAIFSAYSLNDSQSALLIPLSGVQLVGEVLLDGARTAPLAAPRGGYTLSVRGRGRHKIEIHFRVPVIGTIEDRNVLFTLPSLVRSRLSWRIAAGTVEPQVLVKNGAQWTSSNGEQRLEADLGALPLPVHLHWYQPGRPTQASYQAAYVWDLGLEVNHLTAYLRYRVGQGAIKTLQIDLPPELEVSAATAQRAVSGSRPTWTPRFQLRDWYVTRVGEKRLLHLELPYAVSGDFQVTLDLLPHAPLISPAALPLPSPQGIGADGPHYLAYRTQSGLNAQRETSQNLTRIDNKEFAQDWLGGPSLETNFRGIAYRIAPNATPLLLLRLEQTPAVLQGDVDVRVRIDSQQAEFEATAEIMTPNKDLAAIEWELPASGVLAAATGEDVRTWKQIGSHLVVWLNRATTKTRIHLSGWLPLSLREGRLQLELNGPRLVQADRLHTRLRLVPSGDLVLAAVKTQNLQPTKSELRTSKSDVRTSDWDYQTWDSTYQLDCQVQATANANARVLTFAEVADRELRFTTTVDYTVTHGELRQIRLRLRNWDEEKVEVRADRVALLQEPRRVMGDRSWNLPLQTGVRGHYEVTLRGSMPLEKAAGGVPMPEVLVQGVERAEHFVAVAGDDLIAKATGSLQPLRSEKPASLSDTAISSLVNRAKEVWRVSGSEWQVRLLPQARQKQTAAARVYLLEHCAVLGDGQRWLHEERFWLDHEAHASLILDLGAPARVLTASMDGVEATPKSEIRNPKPQSANGGSEFGFQVSSFNRRVWLHMPGQPSVRTIHVRWMYDPPEPLDHPNLASPQLLGAIKGPALWTIMVPPGWLAPLGGSLGWFGAAREAQLALWRADAQLHIIQDLSKERRDNAGSAALATAQQRFDLYCRHARSALELDAGVAAASGPQGHSLTEWLESLQSKNRGMRSAIRNPKTETQLPDSQSGVRIADFETVSGIPFSGPTLPGAEPPTLQLTSVQKQRRHETLIASGQWLGFLAAVWFLSSLPSWRTLLRLFWPEQIAILGLIGWHLAGLTSIVLSLLLLAGCGRAFFLMRGLRGLFGRERKRPSTLPTHNSSAP